ncbi:MAG: hypothetical protein R2909_17020 [Gemmatimonadales bacterium]
MSLRSKHAKDGTAKIYRRHGAKDVTREYAAMKALLKRLDTDRPGEETLEDRGARGPPRHHQGGRPGQYSRAEVERWLERRERLHRGGQHLELVARVPASSGRTSGSSEAEFVSAAGWNVLNVRALEGGLSEAEAKRLLARIKKGIKRAPNRTRYAMNGALIGIGGAMPALAEPGGRGGPGDRPGRGGSRRDQLQDQRRKLHREDA